MERPDARPAPPPPATPRPVGSWSLSVEPAGPDLIVTVPGGGPMRFVPTTASDGVLLRWNGQLYRQVQ